jgi:hypothetical protein
VILLFVVVWAAIFGGIGALLSHARRGSGVTGLAWGIFLGPLGWMIILWRTRNGGTGHGASLRETVGRGVPTEPAGASDGSFSFDDDPY